MLELAPGAVSVVTCVADEAAIDSTLATERAWICRVAPDEIMLVGLPGEADALLDAASERLRSTDPDAVVVDATDGWAMWTLRGAGVRAAFSRLSPLRLPDEGFAQGDVARVPVKLIVGAAELCLLVPAMWREYLRDRILERCRSLGVIERAEPVARILPETPRP